MGQIKGGQKVDILKIEKILVILQKKNQKSH